MVHEQSATLPLNGLTMLDLGGMGPSARCTRILADLGTRWIRLIGPAAAGRVRPQGHDYGALRGAELMEIDLKSLGAAQVFLRMAERADIVVEGFRPGVAERLGIGYDQVRMVNEGIVYCAATGYGQDGPYAQMAGHDLNYQALSGALAAAGHTDRGLPAMPGLTLGDSAGGGWQAALRILAALLAKRASGQGAYVDASAAEGILHLMAGSIDHHLASGAMPEDGMFGGHYACYNIYAAGDGQALAVAALEPKFFANLCRALDLAERASLQYDRDAQDELRAAFANAFRAHTRQTWVDRLATEDVCVTPVLSVAQIAEDPHWRARGMTVDYDHPTGGRLRQLAAFGRSGIIDRGTVPVVTTAGPILTGFGFTPEEISDLVGRSIVG